MKQEIKATECPIQGFPDAVHPTSGYAILATMKARWNTPSYFESAAAADVAAELKRGADPKARDRGGATPLHHAVAWNSDPAVIGLLVSAGADPSARTVNGETPLHFAVMLNNDPAVIGALVESGSNPAIGDELGETPLHRAAATNDNPAVIEALLDAGADPTAMDTWGRTPWERARHNNAIKGSCALRRLRPDDRVNTEKIR